MEAAENGEIMVAAEAVEAAEAAEVAEVAEVAEAAEAAEVAEAVGAVAAPDQHTETRTLTFQPKAMIHLPDSMLWSAGTMLSLI